MQTRRKKLAPSANEIKKRKEIHVGFHYKDNLSSKKCKVNSRKRSFAQEEAIDPNETEKNHEEIDAVAVEQLEENPTEIRVQDGGQENDPRFPDGYQDNNDAYVNQVSIEGDVSLNNASCNQSTTTCVVYKPRGRSKIPLPLDSLASKLKVFYNEFGQPIGQEGNVGYAEYLGFVARSFIPITCQDVPSIPVEHMETAMKVVMARFEINNQRDYDNAKKRIGHLWRQEKYKLRALAEKKYPNLEDRLNHPLEGHDIEDWKKFIEQTESDEYKKRRRRNKESRSKRKNHHHTGRNSYAIVHEKQKKENPNANLYDVLRTANIGKDGTKNEIAKKMEEAVSSGMSKEAAVAEVIRPQRNGHVLGMGFGVSPTVYRYMQPFIECEKKLKQDMMNEVIEQAKKAAQEAIIEKFQMNGTLLPETPTSQPSVGQFEVKKKQDDLSKGSAPEIVPGNEATSNTPYLLKKGSNSESNCKGSSILASKMAGQQCLLFQFDEENIVAEGRVIDTSPEARVHNAPMKIGCFKVCIDKCLNPSSWLIHKTPEFKKVIDAEGSFVMWPSEFIRML